MALPQPDPYERLIVDIGAQEDDGTGDPLREAFDKVNRNFANLFIATGLSGGQSFANLADTPVTYVTDSFLMVNDAGNGIAYAKVTPASDISVSVVDPNITVTLKEVLTGHRQFVGSVDVTNGLTVAGPFVATSGMNLSGNVVINGNLQVTGNTVVKDTYINVDVVSTENEIIVSNTAQATSTTTGALRVAGGAGIQGNLHSSNSYTGTAHNYRVFSDNGYFYSNGTPYLNQVSFNPLFDTQLATKTTDDVAEGSNLYYTNARARNAISGSGSISYNSSTGVISYTTPSTSGVAEGSNLYFTTERARNSISVSGSLGYDSTTGVISYTTPSTSGVAEGDNLYFTTARARNSISATGWSNLSYNSTSGVINISAPSTSDVTEGTNLYYTDSRARAAVSAGSGIIYNSGTGVISADTSTMATGTYVDTAISTAISNFSTTVTNSLATKLSTSDFDSTFDTRLGTKSTSNLAEGTNLYYTDTRARAAISVAGAGTYNSTTGVITVNGGVTSVNGQTGAVYVTLSDIAGTAIDDLDMGGYKVTNLSNPISGTDAANKSYVDATVSAFASSAGGGGLTLPPTFFKAFEVTKDNAVDQGSGTTTIIGNTRIYSFDFSVSGTTRAKRAFFPYATVDSAYTQENGLLKFQYASQLPGKNTPMYTNGGSALFYTNGTTAPIYIDTTVGWTDIGSDVFALPFSTGVNSIRIIVYGDGTHPNTFSNFVLKAFMPATTEYSTQLIGGLSNKAIIFNNTFEEVKHITMTLNYQGYAWVTNMTNIGATLNFSSADANGIVYAAISGY